MRNINFPVQNVRSFTKVKLSKEWFKPRERWKSLTAIYRTQYQSTFDLLHTIMSNEKLSSRAFFCTSVDIKYEENQRHCDMIFSCTLIKIMRPLIANSIRIEQVRVTRLDIMDNDTTKENTYRLRKSMAHAWALED